MQTILNFLVRHNHWFLFIILEGISFMLIVRFNNYQSATFFTSTNGMAGGVYNFLSDIDNYFGLRSENEQLLEQNVSLIGEVTELKAQLKDFQAREAMMRDSVVCANISTGYIFNTASVVNNSLNAVNNFIVIDKGVADGVTSEMGVFDSKGVIGIIYLASNNYSLVLPLLNSKSNISCRVRGGNGFSSLQWDGADVRYSYLVDLPRHTVFERGDTVETSGFSSIFPKGVPVGRIDKIEDSVDGMFYRARVELFVDFASLNSVFIVGNDGHKEQNELESKIDGK